MIMKINKDFIRKITIGTTAYLIEQHKKSNSLSIVQKNGNRMIYMYINARVMYDRDNEQLIKDIFDMAHIDRYVMYDTN